MKVKSTSAALLLVFFFVQPFDLNICAAPLAPVEGSVVYADSTRAGREKPQKERVPKNDREKERSRDGSSGSSSSGSGDFVSECLGNCASGCIESLVSSMFSGSDDKVNNINPTNDSTSAIIPEIPLSASVPAVGVYPGIELGADWISLSFGGDSKDKDEYNNPGFAFRCGGRVMYHNFFFDLSYGYASLSSTPKFDYVTNYSSYTVTDVLRDSKAGINSILSGAGYIFNISGKSRYTYFGLGIGAGVAYLSIKEEGTVERRTDSPTAGYSVKTVKPELSLTKTSPYMGVIVSVAPAQSRLMFDLNFRYIFWGREPVKLESLPLDWNKINGLVNISLGIRFNVL